MEVYCDNNRCPEFKYGRCTAKKLELNINGRCRNAIEVSKIESNIEANIKANK